MAQAFYSQEKRKYHYKRKKSKVFLIIFFALILIGGLAYLVVYSSVFKIKQIKISGVERFNENEIISQLKVFVANKSSFNKFLGADNILSWVNGLKNINKDYPIFENLSIKKSLLRRTIEITVKERERFGAWCMGSATSSIPQCFWFDKNGFVFDEAPYTEGFLINKVSDLSGRVLKTGDLILPDNLFQNFLKIYPVLNRIGLKINNLSFENIDWQEIVSEAGDNSPKIYFSLRNDPDFSISGLNTLKQDPGFNKLLYIDLRTENRIYYKLK